MAHNLAFSIKHHNPNIKVGIWIDRNLYEQLPDKTLFDDIRILEESDYRNEKGKVDPAIAKAQIYRFGTQMSDKFLYLDVDGLCINDLQPLFDDLEGSQIATEIIAKGGKEDKIHYSIWATNDNIWKFFELDDDDTLCAVQSSWAYFEKCEAGDTMQQWLDYFMEVGIPSWMLTQIWGGTLPDELLYQGVYAKMGIVPDYNGKVVFFGNAKAKENKEQVLENYKVLSIYGNGGSTMTLTEPKWIKMYDTKLREYGARPLYRARDVMNDKHANNRQ